MFQCSSVYQQSPVPWLFTSRGLRLRDNLSLNMASCFQVRSEHLCCETSLGVNCHICQLLEMPPLCGLRVSWLGCSPLLLGIISTSEVSGIEICLFPRAGSAQSYRTQTFLGDSPVFSVLLGLLVYGAAIGIYNSLIRPGLDDPVLSVGVPIYIIWLSTTVTRQYSHGM